MFNDWTQSRSIKQYWVWLVKAFYGGYWQHTYVHTYIHTYTHTHTHTYIHTSVHPSIRPSIHPSIHPWVVLVLSFFFIYRGFGFVTFKDPNSVNEVLSHGEHHVCDGKAVRLAWTLLSSIFSLLGYTMVVTTFVGKQVKVNCKVNTGLINFVPRSCLPFVQISSISRERAVKPWNW